MSYKNFKNNCSKIKEDLKTEMERLKEELNEIDEIEETVLSSKSKSLNANEKIEYNNILKELKEDERFDEDSINGIQKSIDKRTTTNVNLDMCQKLTKENKENENNNNLVRPIRRFFAKKEC